jgi:hypothetical protein
MLNQYCSIRRLYEEGDLRNNLEFQLDKPVLDHCS